MPSGCTADAGGSLPTRRELARQPGLIERTPYRRLEKAGIAMSDREGGP